MTYTIQHGTLVHLNEDASLFSLEANTKEQYDIHYLLSILESMNNLFDNLYKLNHALDKRIIELNICGKEKEERE